MNELGKELLKGVEAAEKHKISEKYRLKFHLMPPVGWLNDPNGLCQFHGEYHVFFQYTPFSPNGGLKVWGHYVSRDLIHWEYLGTPLLPDEPWDCHGAYSGSALIEGDEMVVFYTGNVKIPGEHDYINSGRESNTIRMVSKDGRSFSEKQLVLSNPEYPKDYTNHIRDPKVLRKGEQYYMLLGGRKKGDHGAILLYESKDQRNWTLKQELTTKEAFGYMWECPNLIEFEDQWFLVLSPQGLTREEYKNQNVYQSGYMKGSGDYAGTYSLGEFFEWDLGFDFYAPQSFTDEAGRVLLIGWAGLPDIKDEYGNLAEEEGWQHALTVPRVVTMHGERLYQYPVEELNALRGRERTLQPDEKVVMQEGTFDLEITGITENALCIQLTEELTLSYEEGVFAMRFSGDMGQGRTERKAKVTKLHSVRVLCDSSLMEVYVNEGEYVFTTRFYNKEKALTVEINGTKASSTIWEMKEMDVESNKRKGEYEYETI